ncbi:MAG TPA: chromosome segregation protein SMC, partial [Terriglobales bacterium]|nr:chromosome segregation protein SMC [Terriglobales bacterium]
VLSVQNSLEDKSKERAALQTQSEEKQKTVETLINQKNDKERVKSSLKAKFELFQDMVEHYEGYQAGVREILSQKSRIPGLIAPIAGLINVDKEYLTAIEVALGEAAQFILTQDFDSARKGIELLREEKKGRATFIILDRFEKMNSELANVRLEGNGIKGWAKEFVKCKEEYQPVIDFILGRIVLVDTLSNGIDLSSKLGQEYGVVTLDGQVIKGGKVVEGGSAKEIFLVGREEELKGISNELSSLEKELVDLNNEIESKEKERSDLISTISDLDRKTEEEKTRFKDLELDLARQEEMEKGLNQRQEIVQQKNAEVSQELAVLKEKEKDLKSTDLREKRKVLEKEYEKQEEVLKASETEKEGAYLNLNQLRIELVSLQGKEEQIKNEAERLKDLELDLVADEESKRKESEAINSGMEELNRKIEEQKSELETKEKSRVEKEEQAESCQQELERIQPELASLEEELKIKRKAKDELQEILHKLELEKLEVTTFRENLKKKIWEEQEQDLEKVEPLSEEEKKESESYPQRIIELKEKIKELGPVNLLALEEFQQQKDRLDFLQKQVQDLVEAKENLVSTIDKINVTATELFLETFQKVKSNFQQVFETLFEGGEAEVSLIEGIDPLESPIEISARPMGKKLINISQLSGGEKALTALSLLFALYLVKPSPFCILDEVDAPLDDANLTRFLKLIKSFSQKTQFIIITHNKLTMESADVLYGVTMEKPGVSKIVSVRLNPQEVTTEKA